jgi:peptidoglycan/LPS O-acetylase OafA/YrhL
VKALGQLDFKSNAIGFLRLLLAVIVVWSHSFSIGQFGYRNFDPISSWSHWQFTAGELAVGGFFTLSGFLITRSREHLDSTTFLWHRILRIFPGFWVCLIVTAFVLVPIAYAHEFGTLHGYLRLDPWLYVLKNASLVTVQTSIGNIGSNDFINQSLWTLQWEFICYLMASIIIGSSTAPWRLRIVAIGTASVMLTIAILIVTVPDAAYGQINTLVLFLYFGCGSLAYLTRDRVPMRWWIVAAAVVATIATGPTPAWRVVAPPCIAYLALFAAANLPIKGFDRKVDLSYGIYIYAFPLQVLLFTFGCNTWGFVPYFALSLAVSTVAAYLSWTFVERPALSLKALHSVSSGEL